MHFQSASTPSGKDHVPTAGVVGRGLFFLVAEGAGSVIDQIVLLGMKFSTFLIIFDVET